MVQVQDHGSERVGTMQVQAILPPLKLNSVRRLFAICQASTHLGLETLMCV